MIYTQLSTKYKYEVIAEAIYARELEYFHYDFDRINFEYLLKNLPDGDYGKNLKQRHLDTLKQMANVEEICAALISQIDDNNKYEDAVKIAIEKRNSSKV